VRYYIIHITYVVPQNEVDLVRPEHRNYLQGFYEKGMMLFSGPRIPPTGGILVAMAESDEAIRRMVADDPFNIKGVATYDIVEMKPAMWAAELAPFFA
jgi:uncharacterized protein YciI